MEDFIIPLTEDIYFIRGERNGKVPFSNSLLIKDYLIDTGISKKHLRKLKKEFPVNLVINKEFRCAFVPAGDFHKLFVFSSRNKL